MGSGVSSAQRATFGDLYGPMWHVFCPNRPGQLMAVGSADDNITLQPGVRDLAGHIGVGAPHNHPVLGCIVFVLVLDDKPLAGKVVGLTLPPPPELDLESLEVSLVFDDLNERHLDLCKTSLKKCIQAV